MPERETVDRYWRALYPRDTTVLTELRHPDFEILWPQSGERIPSDEAARAIHDAYPGYPHHEIKALTGAEERWWSPRGRIGVPTPAVVQLSGGGGVWVGEARLTYGDGSVWFGVLVLELEDGLVRRETTWFAPTGPVPESRQGLSSPFDWEPMATVMETSASPSVCRARERAMREYFESLSGDPGAAYSAFLHPEAVEQMPQSSEQIEGRDRMLTVYLTHPNRPRLDVRRIMASGDRCIAEVHVYESDEESWGIAIADFDGTKATAITEYWAPRLEAPAWRAEWVEPIE